MCFFSSRRRHTRFSRDWSSDVCSSDLPVRGPAHVPDDAGDDEREADQLADDERLRRLRLVIAVEDERRRGRGGGESEYPEQEGDAVRPHHSSRAATAAPDNASLGTKPTAPEASTSGPKSDASRLEVRTIFGCRRRP